MDVLEAVNEEQERKRRTRRGGQNRRGEVAWRNREEGNIFPVLVGKFQLCDQHCDNDFIQFPEKPFYSHKMPH